ncbi:protein translocase subunit SecF [Aquipuribacter sp. SD81]|uniref:protein translocase subunit SecF n=1 Tax=Aquipuribacter sp. SD81 TaxID=3127703 RepID=UPI003015F856
MKFDRWGNRLYTGEKAYPIVQRRRTWYVVAAVVLLVAVGSLLVRGLNLGIDFTGGSQFQIAEVEGEVDTIAAAEAVESVLGPTEVQASGIGDGGIRVRTGQLTTEETGQVAAALAEQFGVGEDEVTSDFVGATWGQEVSQRALQGLVIFLVLVGLVIAVYFRTWKMAVAALVALVHDIVITVGLYALIGLEVTPSTVIGFLTILGYSLYDTVVVFDKVRENTEDVFEQNDSTYAEEANRAVNQTLVRSINTSVVALLPVAAILFIGALLLGAGTLLDLSLALFIGIAVGTYSSVFLATPLLVHLREREKAVVDQARRVEERRAGREVSASGTAVGPLVTVGADDDYDDVRDIDRLSLRDRPLGQREQPRRAPRSRR